jgi:hypothetical protein
VNLLLIALADLSSLEFVSSRSVTVSFAPSQELTMDDGISMDQCNDFDVQYCTGDRSNDLTKSTQQGGNFFRVLCS